MVIHLQNYTKPPPFFSSSQKGPKPIRTIGGSLAGGRSQEHRDGLLLDAGGVREEEGVPQHPSHAPGDRWGGVPFRKPTHFQHRRMRHKNGRTKIRHNLSAFNSLLLKKWYSERQATKLAGRGKHHFSSQSFIGGRKNVDTVKIRIFIIDFLPKFTLPLRWVWVLALDLCLDETW